MKPLATSDRQWRGKRLLVLAAIVEESGVGRSHAGSVTRRCTPDTQQNFQKPEAARHCAVHEGRSDKEALNEAGFRVSGEA
jgi:hypothetical protein